MYLLAAGLGALSILALIVCLMWKAAYRAGLNAAIDAKIPDQLRPCGDHRNPHQWSSWSKQGNLTQGANTVGIVQQRHCAGCGMQQLRHEMGVPTL